MSTNVNINPGAPPPFYNPQPAYAPVAQSSTNVVVVGGAQPAQTVVIQQRRGVNHALHFLVTLFFFPWVIVWIILCITDDS